MSLMVSKKLMESRTVLVYLVNDITVKRFTANILSLMSEL